MNPLITTWMNYKETEPEFISIDPKSETIPDMTLSLQDLLDRHTQGREIPEFHGSYDDENLDEYFPDLRRLDLVEIQEMQQQVYDHVTETQKKLYELHKKQNEGILQDTSKEAAQPISDPKQPQPQGASKPAEGGKPQPSEGQ